MGAHLPPAVFCFFISEGGSFSDSDKLILDIWYVKNASFVLDLKIVFRTLKTVFSVIESILKLWIRLEATWV
jgi:hypothetical protein